MWRWKCCQPSSVFSYGNQRLQRQFDGLLMMGIVMPETCWAVSVRQGNRFYDWLLHLVGCFIRLLTHFKCNPTEWRPWQTDCNTCLFVADIFVWTVTFLLEVNIFETHLPTAKFTFLAPRHKTRWYPRTEWCSLLPFSNSERDYWFGRAHSLCRLTTRAVCRLTTRTVYVD